MHFSSRLNTGNEGALCIDDDKLFHMRGPATQNVWSPMVVLGTSSLAEAEDRSLLSDSKAATGCSESGVPGFSRRQNRI